MLYKDFLAGRSLKSMELRHLAEPVSYSLRCLLHLPDIVDARPLGPGLKVRLPSIRIPFTPLRVKRHREPATPWISAVDSGIAASLILRIALSRRGACPSQETSP